MRLTSIDALRGIAILGILFMNIPFHANMMLGYVPFDPKAVGDDAITLFYSIFVDGRFRTLFCLLFGAGLAIQYESCKRNAIDSRLFLKSRLNWLFFFGFIHGVFIFGGDILMFYSLAGFLLIRGLSLEPEALFKKARKFLLIGCSLILVIGVLALVFADPSDRVVRGSEEYLEAVAMWQGQFWVQTAVNAGFSLGLLVISPLFILWQALGLMYLGCYLYKTNFFSQGFSTSTFNKILGMAVVSTLLCIAPQLFIADISLEIIPLFSSLSAIFVALVYAHIVVKICVGGNGLMQAFVATGKVAFSLYILQSLMIGLLLRWIIPEFNLTASQLDYLVIAVGYTLIQIVVAYLYLQKYQHGPLEWLWRTLYNRSVAKKSQSLAQSTSNIE